MAEAEAADSHTAEEAEAAEAEAAEAKEKAMADEVERLGELRLAEPHGQNRHGPQLTAPEGHPRAHACSLGPREASPHPLAAKGREGLGRRPDGQPRSPTPHQRFTPLLPFPL